MFGVYYVPSLFRAERPRFSQMSMANLIAATCRFGKTGSPGCFRLNTDHSKRYGKQTLNVTISCFGEDAPGGQQVGRQCTRKIAERQHFRLQMDAQNILHEGATRFDPSGNAGEFIS